MLPLFWKLLRDLRLGLLVVTLVLFVFQLIWARITHRITAQMLGAFGDLGISLDSLRQIVFQGPGQFIQAIMGGDAIQLDKAMHMMSIAYVHPLTITVLCVWAIGRTANAIAGELEKGTMELLLAQPIRRSHVILAHWCVDAAVIPAICLSIWAGTFFGAWLMGLGAETRPSLHVDAWRFLPALLPVAGLLFAISGVTIFLSSMGRSRARVWGLAIFVTLTAFLCNLLGQLWEPMAEVRPYTLFYHFQPQPMVLDDNAWSLPIVWLRLSALFGTGLAGYAAALVVFTRRDLPAPL